MRSYLGHFTFICSKATNNLNFYFKLFFVYIFPLYLYFIIFTLAPHSVLKLFTGLAIAALID